MLNRDKIRKKLKLLSDKELDSLYYLILNEQNSRMKFISNTKNTPRKICSSLNEMFNNAWIH